MDKKILTLFVIFINLTLNAQLVPSKEVINKGIELYNKEKFSEAIEVFKQVNENDSNYNWMLAEMAMTYNAMEKYDSAIIVSDIGLSIPAANHAFLLRTKGTAYDSKGELDKAIEIYKYVIKKYPYKYLSHYNLGISYLKSKQFKKAQDRFIAALKCNPFHASSHLQLGNLAVRQKHYTKALLSWETFLALEPESNRSNKTLIAIENLSNNYIDTSKYSLIKPFDNNELFKEIDHYIRAKIVLSNRFPLAIDFNAAFVKQTQMLMEVLPFESESEDFWAQQYFPFFKNIKDGDFLEPMLYTLLRSTGTDEVVKYNNKNDKLRNEFYNTGSGLSQIKTIKHANLDGEDKLYNFSYFDDGNVYSIGNKNEAGEQNGPWEFYHSNGELNAKGVFKNGKKSGTWKYYDIKHRPDAVENFENGKLNGEYAGFDPETGVKTVFFNYKDGEIDGLVEWFSSFGLKDSEAYFKNSKRDGKAFGYFVDSTLREKYYYKEGEYDGKYISYYSNNQINIQKEYKNGKSVGLYKKYHPNGKLEATGIFKDDKKDGEWKTYYSNGQLKWVENYSQGLLTGNAKKYYYNGNIEEEVAYNEKGEADGIFKYYEFDGKLHAIEEYVKGTIKKAENLDRNGNVINTFNDRDGTFDFVTLDSFGNKAIKGSMKNGRRNGEWISYFFNGKVSSVSYYEDGVPNGKMKTYHVNGELKETYEYKDGQIEGEYIFRTEEGIIKQKGYYKNGDYDNLWSFYLNNGELDYTLYYTDGMINGWSTSYASDSKISSRSKYYNKKILEVVNFSQEGDTVSRYNLLEGEMYKIEVQDGITSGEFSLKGGLYHGDYKWYYENGKVSSEGTYKSDNKWGTQKSYHSNGKLKLVGEYINNKQTGKWISYYPGGELKEETWYFEGQLDSIENTYYENGKLMLQQNYYNGILQGDVLQYDITGEIMVKLIFNKNELTGYQYLKNSEYCDTIYIKSGNEKILAYYNNGVKSYEVQLKNHVFNGKRIKYYSDGKIRELKTYEKGNLNGEFAEYYPDGKVKKQGVFKNSMREGLFTYYWPNGKKKSETNYLHDEINGEKRQYNEKGKLISVSEYWSGKPISYTKK